VGVCSAGMKCSSRAEASATLQHFIPAEHTTAIVLFFLYLFLFCGVLFDSYFCFVLFYLFPVVVFVFASKARV
jgi:hypothetical protein